MKKRVLLFGSVPPPLHGTSIAFRNLLNGLKERNFVVNHINCQFSKNINEIEKFSLWKLLLFFRYFFSLIHKSRTFKPDYIIICPAFSFFSFLKDSAYSNLASAVLKERVIAWVHGNGLTAFYNSSNFLVKKYIEYTFHNYHLIVPVANILSERNYSFFSPHEKIVPIHNGIMHVVDQTQVNVGTNGMVTVLYLSNMELTKGWKLLFNAAQTICAKSDKVQFHFYGNPAANSTEDEINVVFQSSPFRDKVCYFGPLNHNEKNKVFSQTDIFCFPTFYKHEAFPLVILEAMQAGLPVVSTTAGGITEAITDNKGGFIVEENNPEALIEKLISLINSRELRMRFGQYNLMKFKSDYTMETHLDKWEDLLSK